MVKVKYSVNFINHIVRPGDSFNKLVKQYNSEVSSILAANPNINPNCIYCGQRIYIPVRRPLINGKTEKIKKQYSELLKECEVNEPENMPSTEIPEEVTIDVSGMWYTNWGEMMLTQTDNNVSGTYTWDDGKIEGVLNGNVLTGTWSEKPTYSPPGDAGVIEFIFNGNSFTGTWGYGDEPLSGLWEGTRSQIN